MSWVRWQSETRPFQRVEVGNFASDRSYRPGRRKESRLSTKQSHRVDIWASVRSALPPRGRSRAGDFPSRCDQGVADDRGGRSRTGCRLADRGVPSGAPADAYLAARGLAAAAAWGRPTRATGRDPRPLLTVDDVRHPHSGRGASGRSRGLAPDGRGHPPAWSRRRERAVRTGGSGRARPRRPIQPPSRGVASFQPRAIRPFAATNGRTASSPPPAAPAARRTGVPIPRAGAAYRRSDRAPARVRREAGRAGTARPATGSRRGRRRAIAAGPGRDRYAALIKAARRGRLRTVVGTATSTIRPWVAHYR